MNINYWCPWRRHNLKLNENEESNIHDFSHSLSFLFSVCDQISLLFLSRSRSPSFFFFIVHLNVCASSAIKERQMNINIFTSRLCSRNTSKSNEKKKLDSFWFSFKSEQTGIDIDVDDCCIRNATRHSCCKSSTISKTSRVLWLNNDSSIQSICIINIDFHRLDQIARIHLRLFLCVCVLQFSISNYNHSSITKTRREFIPSYTIILKNINPWQGLVELSWSDPFSSSINVCDLVDIWLSTYTWSIRSS